MQQVDEAYVLKLELEKKTAEFKASIAPLEDRLAALQEEIKAAGAGNYEGATAKATVSIRRNVTLDAEAVFAAVDDPHELIPAIKFSVPAVKKILAPKFFENASKVTETLVLKVSAK